jgi:hypothetical protein
MSGSKMTKDGGSRRRSIIGGLGAAVEGVVGA